MDRRQFFAAGIGAALPLIARNPPRASIDNGVIAAELYLPDARTGYYRGTRFDWSGVIASLKFAGHSYVGQWFEKYDPVLHDAITGPVEEFRTNGAGLGYAEAKPGGTFIRIGVGVVRKPDEPKYEMFKTYDIVDHGKWRTRPHGDRVEFSHELKNGDYAYRYQKVVRLERNKPELLIEHSLRNLGRKSIETDQYNHNFFMIDGQPTGPDTVVKFPFALKAKQELKEPAKVGDGEITFERALQPGESVYGTFEGFSGAAKDYDIVIENRKAGAGVRIQGDKELSDVVFWAIRTTACPEPYLHFRVEPGKQAAWRLRYTFYTLPKV